ncbi:MAG TPA: helix-turn-helix domain-containing protein [Herbaspirillum sp.]
MMPIVEQAMFALAPGVFAGQSAATPRIMMLQAGANGVTLSTADTGSNEVQQHVFGPGWSGLIVLDRVACEVEAGGGAAYEVEIAALTKLQAFLDAALTETLGSALNLSLTAAKPDDATVNNAPLLIAVDFPAALDIRNWSAIERWFLAQSVKAGNQADIAGAVLADFSYIAAVLRTHEYYKLVRFLLSQPASRTMHELSVEYGLSYSHFRKLCREALGRGGKAEFQYWRNVRALLDMVDHAGQGASLTDVALRQGFASSSHFSDAMKGQFGIAPRYLTRALNIGKP